ncbi:MAG: hypothetical protein NC311_02420 [Muribaculaceae bacterium]|nr:hypothetical protein [Muribaculaceae bacterium]
MKTKFIIPITILTIFSVHGNAIAYCDDWGDYMQLKGVYSNCTDMTASFMTHNCATMNQYESFMWHETDGKCYYVQSCASCPSGYSLQYIDADATRFTYNDFCWYEPDEDINKAPYLYHTCVKDKNCPNDTDWAEYRTGYQKRTVYNADCVASIQYRCAAGYYGSSTNGTSGCTQCPTWSDVYTTSAKTTLKRGTSAAGATVITSCYVASGTYYDVSGTFKISSTCQYKK